MTAPSITAQEVAELLNHIRDQKPLVHCITNFVSMDLMANTLLAIGASPAMAHSIEEVADFVKIASVLLINIGTVTADWAEPKKLAAENANSLNKPWVLDPVGCGATPYRTKVCQQLAALSPWIIRGNASEIMALSGTAAGPTKGVDSTAASDEALHAAIQLSKSYHTVVAVSGAVDIITDGSFIIEVHNGTPLLQYITATGCSVTAVCAAFCAVLPRERALEAAACGLAVFNVAAEAAEKQGGVKGPGSLRVGLMDALYTLSEEEILSGVKLVVRGVV